jgi:hypothetical protein
MESGIIFIPIFGFRISERNQVFKLIIVCEEYRPMKLRLIKFLVT